VPKFRRNKDSEAFQYLLQIRRHDLINFLPEWLKDYKNKKRKLRLKTITIVFLILDILMVYASVFFAKSENVTNKKINEFFSKKQITNISASVKSDKTYNTLKIALNESLSGYEFEALNVNNNEAQIIIGFKDTKALVGLISKIENNNSFKINSIAPFSATGSLSKYKIGLEAVK
jgi:hypothetical protein